MYKFLAFIWGIVGILDLVAYLQSPSILQLIAIVLAVVIVGLNIALWINE